MTADALRLTLRAEDVREANRLLGRLSAETQTLASENWPAIVRVANALLKHRTLTENDVDLVNQKATDISMLLMRIHP
jgi:hypothetical protein